MTKRAKIEALYQSGMTSIRLIVQATDYNYGYVSNILANIRNPGILLGAYKRWLAKNPYEKYASFQRSKKWKKDHPEKAAISRAHNLERHFNATFPQAIKRYQWWENEDIKFLRNNCTTLTIRQMALVLGRTYSGVQHKGHVLGLDMRGDKMGRRI